MKMRKRWIGFGFIGLTLFVLVILGVMLLWNHLLPTLFGISTITFWQAAGLLILARLLFGCFRGRHCGHHHFGNQWHKENKLHEKWMNLTPEERKDYIHKRMTYMKHHHWDFDNCCHETDKNTKEEQPQKEDDQK